MLSFDIPDNTFYDPEDGDTSNLQLLFETFEYELSVAPSSWIQLSQTSRTLYGLPLRDDVGRHSYKLVAADSNGRLAKMTFHVYVTDDTGLEPPISHELAILLMLDYRQFLHTVSQFYTVHCWSPCCLYVCLSGC